MVSHIIGNYLLGRGLITKEQFAEILKKKKRVRAKLGLIAVSEGILSYDEVKSINVETDSDRAFAEIAVERGYLTEGQVSSLLRKQGDSYMSFAQTLENQKLMNIVELEEYLMDFQQNNDLTIADLEDLKSDDVNRILPMYFPEEASHYIDVACVAVRNLIRNVDSRIYPLKAFITDQFEALNGTIQFVEGKTGFSLALVGKDKALAAVASRYMHDQYEEVDEEVLDVISEIISDISSQYASALSQEGAVMDLLPPRNYLAMKEIKVDGMLVLPLVERGSIFYLLINMMNLVTITE